MTQLATARIEYNGRKIDSIGIAFGSVPQSVLVCRVDPAMPEDYDYNWRIEHEDCGLKLEWERDNSVNKIGLEPGAGRFRTRVWCEVKLPIGSSGMGHVVLETQRVIVDHVPGGYAEDPNGV
jgi:hypothetical protein